jgi:hypothetical protein
MDAEGDLDMLVWHLATTLIQRINGALSSNTEYPSVLFEKNRVASFRLCNLELEVTAEEAHSVEMKFTHSDKEGNKHAVEPTIRKVNAELALTDHSHLRAVLTYNLLLEFARVQLNEDARNLAARCIKEYSEDEATRTEIVVSTALRDLRVVFSKSSLEDGQLKISIGDTRDLLPCAGWELLKDGKKNNTNDKMSFVIVVNKLPLVDAPTRPNDQSVTECLAHVFCDIFNKLSVTCASWHDEKQERDGNRKRWKDALKDIAMHAWSLDSCNYIKSIDHLAHFVSPQ